MTLRRFALVLALLAAGCQRGPEASCQQTIDVFADALERCGTAAPTRAETEAQLETSITMGMGCEAVVDIRDQDELHRECFPAIEDLDCGTLSTGPLPSSCVGQILVVVD
jgi:hypothetical protein